MPTYASQTFARRIAQLEHKHATLKEGAVTVLRDDGLMVMEPQRPNVRRHLLALAIFLLACLIYKAATYAGLGPQAYSAKVEMLANGTLPETMLAHIFVVDPVTETLVAHLSQAYAAAEMRALTLYEALATRFWVQG